MIERLPESQFEEVQTPLLENMVIGVPPVFEGLTRQLDKLAEQPLLGPRAAFPPRQYSAMGFGAGY
jgi:tubulin gamma